MKLNIFNENDHVLLLGEGNFSFSVALSKFNLNIKITATCFESSVNEETARKNIEYLTENGIRVLLNVDATKLAEHQALQLEAFDKVIFNFPHVGGKMRIEKNRELLKQFFMAVGKSLKDNGQVLMTLCKGQGGTLVDSSERRWDDSWKVTEMAAHGNFILTKVEPFDWSLFENYNVTGYRSLNKGFHTTGALIHILKKSEPPNIKNIVPNFKINICPAKIDNWKHLMAQINLPKIMRENVFSHEYTFHITLSVGDHFNDTELYVILYNFAGCIINDLELIDSYRPSLEMQERRTYRISYKSDLLPLYRKRVIDIHQNLISNILERNLNIIVIK